MARTRGTRRRVRIDEDLQQFFGGKTRFSAYIADEEAAKAWIKDRQLELQKARIRRERVEQAGEPASTILFLAAAGHWLDRATDRTGKPLGERTRTWYSEQLDAHILPALGGLRCSQIGRDRLRDYVAARRVYQPKDEEDKKRPASDAAIRRELLIIRAVLGWARDEDYSVDPSAWKVTRPKARPAIERAAPATKPRASPPVGCATSSCTRVPT